MEHRALVRLAAENAATTYAFIAAELPGSEIESGPGWVRAQGPLPHSACNFAMALESEAIPECLAFVKEDRARLLYTFTGGSDPAHDPDVRRVHRMSVMVEESAPVAHPLPELELADADRAAIARFMAHQFFRNMSREFRDEIATATTNADALELVAFQRPGAKRIIGALMFGRSAEMIGLYNLCVDSSERDRGVGRRMMRWVSERALAEGRRLTLQCDPSLVPWYRDQGLRELVDMHVWSASCGS